MRRVLLSLALLVPIAAEAANNTVLLTPCSSGCVTMRSQDVGAGVESAVNILGDTSGNAIYGTAGTANANVLTVQGIASMTPILANPGTAANWGLGATGAAVPANGILAGMSQGGNLTALTGTSGNLNVNVAASGITQAVSVASGQIVDGGDATQGAKADAASCTGSQSVVSCLKQIDADIKATGTVQGSAASGASVSGNPLFNGGRAQNTEQTAVTNGQAVGLAADLVGKLIVLPYANPENWETAATAAITDTTSTPVLASAGGSLRHNITSCKVTNSHATVGTYVQILDGASVLDSGYAAPAGGGWSTTYPTPMRGTAATALNCQATTTGSNFKCSCQGYKGT